MESADLGEVGVGFQGEFDLTNPVSGYAPELKGSDWDKVTVEEPRDMAAGLDSTEHEEPNEDARSAGGWSAAVVKVSFQGCTSGRPRTTSGPCRRGLLPRGSEVADRAV